MKKIPVLLSIMALVFGISVTSAMATITYIDTPIQETTGIDTYQTTGGMMGGMKVTFSYLSGATSTQIWKKTNNHKGGVSVTAASGKLSLSLNGDSYLHNWKLKANKNFSDQVTSIFIDAGAGNAVFDVWKRPKGGTSGSLYGYPFTIKSWNGPKNVSIDATYSGAVQLTGAIPVGDLYRYLQIDFTPITPVACLADNTDSYDDSYQASYFGAGMKLRFRADTDSLKYEGDIGTVPEPSTILLMGFGLLGLLGYSRKRLHKS